QLSLAPVGGRRSGGTALSASRPGRRPGGDSHCLPGDHQLPSQPSADWLTVVQDRPTATWAREGARPSSGPGPPSPQPAGWRRVRLFPLPGAGEAEARSASARRGQLLKAIYLTDHAGGREFKLEPVPWSVYSGGVRFCDDGSMAIVQGHFDADWKKNSVVVWDVASGRRLATWTRPGGRLDAVQLAPDGRSMAIGDSTGNLTILEMASGQERASFRHGGVILSAAFQADGTKVVASSLEAPIYVWDLLANP